MRYEEPQPISKPDAMAEFESGDAPRIREALVRAVFHVLDREWLEGVCVTFARNEDWTIRAVAATCLGHLARIHGRCTSGRVLPVLERLKRDHRTAGQAEDALSDIRTFVTDESD